MRTKDQRGRTAEEAVLRLVQEHAAELLRFARRFSYCADDAHDAYQRSLEILVRRMRTDPPASPLSWLRTVLRHESLAIRAQRDQLVARTEVDFECHESRGVEDPAERAAGIERLEQAAEALQRLKPQELTALALRAEGLTYKEICARTGWTYTKTNRCVTEGRRALVERLGAIESGAECSRWTPLLSALADGEATAAQLAELRPHLRRCVACRATLRDFHAAPAQVAALVPPVLVPLAVAPGGSVLGQAELALHALAERAGLAVMRAQGALEGLTGGKLAVVAASTAALAGGGAAIEQATRDEGASHRDRADLAVSAPVAPAGIVPARFGSVGAPMWSKTRPRAPRPVRRAEFAAGRERTGASEFARRSSPAEFASADRLDGGSRRGAGTSTALPIAPSTAPPSTPSSAGPSSAGPPSVRGATGPPALSAPRPDATAPPSASPEFAGP